MSGTSIDAFRGLVTSKTDLNIRRVTIEHEGNQPPTISAPKDLFGRIAEWIRPTVPNQVNLARINQTARKAFYDALVKAEGKPFADKILQDTVGVSGEAFVQKATPLYAARIKQVLDATEKQRAINTNTTLRQLDAFYANRRLSDEAVRTANTLGHPGLDRDDPAILQAFSRQIWHDPEYGRRRFTEDDFLRFAHNATKEVCEQKQQRFDEQYSELAKLDVPYFHDADTFFDAVKDRIENEWSNTVPGGSQIGDWAHGAIDQIANNAEKLGKMPFDPTEVGRLKADLLDTKAEMQATQQSSKAMLWEKFFEPQRQIVLEALTKAQEKPKIQLEALGVDQQVVDTLLQKLEAGVNETLLNLSRTDGSLADKSARDELLKRLESDIQEALRDVDVGEDRGRKLDVASHVAKQIIPAVSKSLEENRQTFANTRQAQTKAFQLHTVLNAELDNQIGKLENKAAFLDEYLQHDPLSEKTLAYNKLMWMQTTRHTLDTVVDQLRDHLVAAREANDPGEQAKVEKSLVTALQKRDEARQRVMAAEREWREASTERSNIDTSPSLFKTHPFEQHIKDEKKFLAKALEDAKVWPPGNDVGKFLKRHQVSALDTLQSWATIERRMVVHREGVTRTYTSEIKPASQLGHGIGDAYAQDGIQGVSAGNKRQATHARNLQVSALFRHDEAGNKQLVSQTIRHGVLDPWEIKDKDARRDAARAGAREVLNVAVTMDEAFLAQAKVNTGQNDENWQQNPLSHLVHVNLNLTTADDLEARKLSPGYREHDFTMTQFDAFEHNEGVQRFDIDGQDVRVKIDTITLSFGVNAVALGSSLPWSLNGPEERWPQDIIDHNRDNLNKLIGTLNEDARPGGHIGSIVDRLRAKAEQQDLEPQDRAALLHQIGRIQDETDLVRHMFNTGSYKHGIEDAYKMDRHLMRLCTLADEALKSLGDHNMKMSLSQGCKSNKDRGGVGDVEHKAQAIIEDMGGRVLPGEKLEGEDKTIYNTVMTSSGQLEAQQMNTRLPGSKNAEEIKARIDDEAALIYAKGFASFTKA
ncbi:MAG: inositol phosphate phosphatase SopB [Acetobacteraceae bacterium]